MDEARAIFHAMNSSGMHLGEPLLRVGESIIAIARSPSGVAIRNWRINAAFVIDAANKTLAA